MNNKNSVEKVLEYILDKGGLVDIRENIQEMSDVLALSPGTISQVIHRLLSAGNKILKVKPGIYEIYSEVSIRIV